jgi:hypothetical protein
MLNEFSDAVKIGNAATMKYIFDWENAVSQFPDGVNTTPEQ